MHAVSGAAAAAGGRRPPTTQGHHLAESARLAYKAYEIEELVDIYFYRRLGYVVAITARALRLSPNAVSVLAGVAGGVGGALIAWPHLALIGVALMVLHGVIDSADGQLARMTGQTSELGRLLDGLAGYVTYFALYVALIVIVAGRWGLGLSIGLALVSGVCTALQAQMYDYYRTAYAAYVLKGRLPTELTQPSVGGVLGPVVRFYAATQQALLGLHRTVEDGIAARVVDGRVLDRDRDRYRACFYRPVRGWNLLGDNVRRYAIAVFVLVQRPEWFIPFTIVGMNLVVLLVWLYQQAADRRFLAAPVATSSHTR